MPDNLQALLLVVWFVIPGFVFVEVRAWSRPTRKLSTFDKTVLTILVSTVLHISLVFLVLLALHLRGFDLTLAFDQGYVVDHAKEHPLLAYAYAFAYFVATLVIACALGWLVGKVEWTVTPVFLRVIRRDKPNAVLVQMKNGDFYTGILELIPGDYDILQSPAKDFTLSPPGRYKPKDLDWQNLQAGETVVLNTTNIDALRIIVEEVQEVPEPSKERPRESPSRQVSRKRRA